MPIKLPIWCCLILFSALPLGAEQVQLPAIADNSIVMVDGEWELNGGAQGRIRIKGNQHIVAMQFDTSAIVGKQVEKATLVCFQGEQAISAVTISTIATPWDETRSNALTAGRDDVIDWGYAGARFPAVCGGNSHTLVQPVNSVFRDGKYHWEIPVDMVHAMAVGIAHGLAIHEHAADYSRNPTIFAHEQAAKKPYLLVQLADEPAAPPEPATNLKLTSSDGNSARLSLTAPARGFAYQVTVNGQPLGRHNIPLAVAGRQQTIPLRDLPASIRAAAGCEIEVVTINRTGQQSEPAVLRDRFASAAAIEKPNVQFPVKQAAPTPNLSVIPVTDKYDATAAAVGSLPENYRTHNPIYDGRTVRLTAAAGEVVGFQLLLRGATEQPVSVKLTMDRPQLRIDLYQAAYVMANGRSIPDPLLPLPDSIRLRKDSDQVVVADIFIPFDASAGMRRGELAVSDGRVIPIEISVQPFALPREASFFCEMNSYGLPDHVNDYYALQQVAYDHRVHANVLHYSHHTAAPGARKSSLDMRLRSGRRMDNKRYDNVQPGDTAAFWDDFSEAFGPVLDGSLFQDGHRGPLPVPGFYLTFHESWPLNCRAFFNGNPDAYLAFADQPAYARTYVNILNDFAQLADAKGWHKAGFQVYFNNKGSLDEPTKAPWILDEPSSYWDYRALRFYGELTDQGRERERDFASSARIDYRIDISRPEYTRGELDGRDDLWIVSTSAFQNYRRLVTDRLESDGLRAWVYGTSNHIHDSNRNIQAWALDAWQDGATGIVPWQTVDKSGRALREADQLGIFIFDQNAEGETVIHHSLRLKAYREAQQLIEYLNLVQQRRGWSRAEMRSFVAQYVDLDATVQQTNTEDAGTTGFGRLQAGGLERLRLAAVALLQ